MSLTFCGLDCEMTGPFVSKHRIIQIGVAFQEGTSLFSRVGWTDAPFDPDSLAAIGVDPGSLSDGPAARDVDAYLARSLAGMGLQEGTLVPVGWGVTGFDLPFVITTFPQFTNYLHHHSIELNTICYALAGTASYLGRTHDASTWKSMAKSAAESQLQLAFDLSPEWHNAEYDAKASLTAWNWLRAILSDLTVGLGDRTERSRAELVMRPVSLR